MATVDNWDFKLRLLCEEGHLIETFVAPQMSGRRIVYDGKFYRVDETDCRYTIEPNRGLFYLRKEELLVLCREFVGVVHLRAHCCDCEPVYTRHSGSLNSKSWLSPHHPAVHIDLGIFNGEVAGIKRGERSQSRAQLRAQLVRGGNAVLADDDPVVVEHKATQKKSEGEP